MTLSYVWHDVFMHVTWLIYVWDMTYSCDMTCSWDMTYLCDMTYSCDLFVCATAPIHLCKIIHPCGWHESSIRAIAVVCMTDFIKNTTPPNPPSRKAEISRYKLKLHQISDLNLYCTIPGNVSLWIRLSSGVELFVNCYTGGDREHYNHGQSFNSDLVPINDLLRECDLQNAYSRIVMDLKLLRKWWCTDHMNIWVMYIYIYIYMYIYLYI